MAQYKVPIRFSRKLKLLFFLLISKIIFAAYMDKRTPMFSQLFYLIFFFGFPQKTSRVKSTYSLSKSV